MVGKRLVVVGLLVLAGLVGAPRPAQAQWLDFMKWLSSLDPGPFRGVEGSASVACREVNDKGKLVWDAGLFCTDELPRKSTAKRRDPGASGNTDAMILKSDVKAYVAFTNFYGVGLPNLHYPPGSGIDEKKNMSVNIFTPNINYRPTRIVDFGIGVGWVHFSGAAKPVNTVVITPTITFSPALLTRSKWFVWAKHTPIRLSVQYFPTGFTPDEFGALTPEFTRMTGKPETVAAVSFILQIGRTR